MGGTNPYISEPAVKKPNQKFSVTYANSNQVIDIDPAAVPSSDTGLPGSVLDIALASNVDIDHACGGVCACSTCHIYVTEGMEFCSAPTEEEQDMLDMAPALKTNSRLACQCVPNGEGNVKVEIPNWNRNAVREGQ